MDEFDVVIISDFRLPGGTNHSTSQELKVHRYMGLRTGLLQCNSRLSAKPLAWAEPILRNLQEGLVEPLTLGRPARAKLALLRHPIALEAMPDLTRWLAVERAIVVANQTAVRPDGTLDYDAAAIDELVTSHLGRKPVWAPIGPVVRTSLEGWTDQIEIRSEDWTNIFAQSSQPIPRTGFVKDRPIIGRHSRQQPAKWPDNAKDIRHAYPTTDDYDVRILGGARPAIEIIGGRPTGWTIHKFGAMQPDEFLKEVDFWVYFHHPQWREAYGRAIMEALWSGAVVILPEYLRVTYGNAAVYGDPQDVKRIIEEFRTGTRDYLEQSRLGQAYAASHSAQLHIDRVNNILDELLSEDPKPSPPSGSSQRIIAPQKTSLALPLNAAIDRFTIDARPKALFVTSNGAGMGHLTRMLGIARSISDSVSPVFLSMSQGLGVVANAGFPFEYVPFNSALQTKSALWHEYFDDRLSAAIDHYDARIIIFDGTWPYRGMLQTFGRHDLLKVWIRRGMWKSRISPEQLTVSEHFDLVVEPGDYAQDYDEGATTKVTDARRVAPMTVLRGNEILSRDDAREELGLSDPDVGGYALVTLGAGNINDLSSTQEMFLEAIGAHSGWEAVTTKVPIAAAHHSSLARSISTFPLARYTNAFDFAVSAAGYNSFSEWISGALPTIWVPNLATQTDDQDARTRWAHDTGRGIRDLGIDESSIRDAVGTMVDSHSRAQIQEALMNVPLATGAADAAALIREAWTKRT